MRKKMLVGVTNISVVNFHLIIYDMFSMFFQPTLVTQFPQSIVKRRHFPHHPQSVWATNFITFRRFRVPNLGSALRSCFSNHNHHHHALPYTHKRSRRETCCFTIVWPHNFTRFMLGRKSWEGKSRCPRALGFGSDLGGRGKLENWLTTESHWLSRWLVGVLFFSIVYLALPLDGGHRIELIKTILCYLGEHKAKTRRP